jgi:K+-transporting ATPase KdpF subunit
MHSGVNDMDYIIGGLTTVLLFVYLIYALLKPEKF